MFCHLQSHYDIRLKTLHLFIKWEYLQTHIRMNLIMSCVDYKDVLTNKVQKKLNKLSYNRFTEYFAEFCLSITDKYIGFYKSIKNVK